MQLSTESNSGDRVEIEEHGEGRDPHVGGLEARGLYVDRANEAQYGMISRNLNTKIAFDGRVPVPVQ